MVPKLDHDDDDGREDEDMDDPDIRINSELSHVMRDVSVRPKLTYSTCLVRQKDARIQRDGELSDSDDEGMGGRRHRQNHGESSEKPSSRRKGKSPEKRATNGAATNGGSTSPTKTDKAASKDGDKANSSTPELNPDAPPAPKGTVVSTGAIVPTEDLEKGEIKDDVEMKATGTETSTPQTADVDMDAVNSEIEAEKATGEINKVGTEAKGADKTGVIPPAPTAGGST